VAVTPPAQSTVFAANVSLESPRLKVTPGRVDIRHHHAF